MAHLLSRLWVTVMSLHFLALHQQSAHPWLPVPWLLDSSGWGGTPRQGCTWVEIPCTVGLAAGRAWGDHGSWIHKPGLQCSASSARVTLQLWLKARSWQTPKLWGHHSCSALLRGGVPTPGWELPGAAWEARSSRTHRCVRLREGFFPTRQH